MKISNDVVFVLFKEQELYQKEGLGVNEVHYVDNQDCIGQYAYILHLLIADYIMHIIGVSFAQ